LLVSGNTLMIRTAFILLVFSVAAQGHDAISTKLTWSREISRIVYVRCTGCHRPGGWAFSLIRYAEVRPWAKAIEEEVLERRMPPWGAVKGFGDFRNDQALPQQQLDLIASWVEGGAPEGDPRDLPAGPTHAPLVPALPSAVEIAVSGEFTIRRPLILDGIMPKSVQAPASSQRITAELPDGSIEPLLWLQDYDMRFNHPFLLRRPMYLPAGSRIHGVSAESTLLLLTVSPTRAPGRRNAPY
jgi:hypothetical protein